jgi:hypothetical protein
MKFDEWIQFARTKKQAGYTYRAFQIGFSQFLLKVSHKQ